MRGSSQESTQSAGSGNTTASPSESPPTPLLSILNVVVDHVMVEPCPLEPQEFDTIHNSNHDVVDRVTDTTGSQCANDHAVKLFPEVEEVNDDGPSFSDVFPASTKQKQTQHHNSTGNVDTGTARNTNVTSVRVPVLRIFGPVLRNGDDSTYHKCTQDETNSKNNSVENDNVSDTNNNSYSLQPQSGCLHIHGAYPYMLARPVIAGPDGSMHHGHSYHGSSSQSNLSDNTFSQRLHSEDSFKRSNIDWDNVDSVSHILEEVHQRLEGSLHASMENNNSTNPTQQSKPQSLNAPPSTHYIRSVTVVTGRGFYTYCSGPPAPFLKVEYYDPSLRWRVKMILERGLELSNAYHPDPRVYDYEFEEDELEYHGGGGGGNAENVRPLKFRCYEAHIPYTMQVFKDYNLAGLKYVNVGDVRFRQPLPKGLRKRTKQDFLRRDTTKQDNCAFFLKDNVGKELLWHNCEDSRPQKQEHWLKKHTSCDLEFDTTVENLLNIHDVMTALPSPQEERQKIHWRAVPSLREIWEQERKRMKILLTPDKDFLSMEEYDEEDSSSSCSNSDDEESYFEPQGGSTPQFTLNVKKNASVPGTRLAVRGNKRLFGTSEGLEDDFRRAMADIVSRHDRFIDNIDKKIVSGSNGEHISMNFDDGIEALASLGNQFTQNSADGDDIIFGSQSSGRTPDSTHTIHTSVHASIQAEKYTMTQLTQADVDEDRKLLESDFHDEMASDGDHSDDDFICEEDELGEVGLEQTLTFLASQAVGSNETDEHSIECEDQFDINDDVDHSDDESINSCADVNSNNLIEESPGPTHSQKSTDDVSSNISSERIEGVIRSAKTMPPGHLLFEPTESLRRENITSHSNNLHPFPNIELDRCPPWFKFQWNGSGTLPPISRGSFFEPVKRAPSYNRVRMWMKASNKHQHNKDATKFSDVNVPAYADSTQIPHTQFTQYSQLDQTQEEKTDPLSGLGQQGCRVQVSGGGGLKTTIHTPTTFTPMTIMSIEIHVQCRIKTPKGQREMAMVPDSSRDAVYAVVYLFCRDPGGGENIEVLERGSVLVLIGSNHCGSGMSNVNIEYVTSERSLLLRVASIVKMKDPDILLSWDTQGGGIGYLVERGVAVGKSTDGSKETSSTCESEIDMVRLLGRMHKGSASINSSKTTDTNPEMILMDGVDNKNENNAWSGSGLGGEWDDRVGAGAAASSIAGRIVICVWKICSEECKHPNASYQPATVSAILNKRIPYHDDLLLTRWYSMNDGCQRWRVIKYRLLQATSNIMLIDELDVLGRAGEAARLSGVEFSQSLPGIRGSQYKVEGVLLRALQSVRSNERGEKKGHVTKGSSWQGTALTTTLSAYESQSQTQSPWKRRRQNKQDKGGNNSADKDLGYFFYSPSKDDCSKQEALECQALTLEPLSGFQFDPVVVCDFTALYPSLVIAYNLCYSTVAGKLDYHSTRREMRCAGRTTGRIGPFQYSEKRTAAVIKHHMKSIQPTNQTEVARKKRDRAYAVPTGSLFVSESVLKGVLPQVLDEMLSTRAMLKKAAKEYKKQIPNLSPAILRQIEARQLALKYVANVTYGYTSATFSGRSASPLVADAIVECGRRTLTNAINLANQWGKKENGPWHGAQVLYGDTDSVFIKLPNRSVKEAFTFGEEYCKAVTASNPPPVQLKLEKVYTASLLQTKKKYCGMMYESASQKLPVFEAKGIETVRRDQCALTQKILRNALIKAFKRGIAPTKDYLRTQWSLIHAGKFPVSDFVLTGRVRSRYRGGRIGPVQAALARRLGEIDPGRVVRHKERLPYVIVASPGKAFKLRDCVLTPLELLEQWDAYTIHSGYYITKHVNAALQRCFSLAPFNANVHAWYEACPKPRQKLHYWPLSRSGSSLMISSYFGSDICSICKQKCKSTGSSRVAVCPKCSRDRVNVTCIAVDRLNQAQAQSNKVASICSSCNGCHENSATFAAEEFVPSKKKHSPFAIGTNQRRAGRLCNPMANCVCIDCPMTYLRHELREMEIEASELMKAVNL